MEFHEKLMVELSEQDVKYAVQWWLDFHYKNDPRGKVTVNGNFEFKTEIRDRGQGRLEAKFQGADINIYFTKEAKK